jgi:hypothetical protein
VWRVEGVNDQQADAVASALGRDTTFIWGPPGTGKTRTIGKIGEQLVRAGRSVLIVSHTNSAVDQALLEVAHDLANDLVPGSVLRLGDPRDLRLLKGDGERLRAETHIRERSQELLDRKEEAIAERAEKTARLANVRRLLAIAEWAGRRRWRSTPCGASRRTGRRAQRAPMFAHGHNRLVLRRRSHPRWLPPLRPTADRRPRLRRVLVAR